MLAVPSEPKCNVLKETKGRRLGLEVISFVVVNGVLEWGIVRNECARWYVEMEYSFL